MLGMQPKTGSGGLRFRLFGVPVSVHASFLLVVVILGFGGTFAEIGIWTAIITGSLMVHELGHAFAARRLDGEPTISLYGMGGITAFTPAKPMTRGQSIGVSVAGPFAGIALGLIVLGLFAFLGRPEPGLGRFAFNIAVFANIAWSFVNLLPVLPLDGGAVLSGLLPGDEPTRMRRAHYTSVVTGVLVAVAIVVLQPQFLLAAVLFGYLAVTNLLEARRSPTAQTSS